MSLTTIQSTKQQTRHYLAVAADKMKIATAQTMRGENKVWAVVVRVQGSLHPVFEVLGLDHGWQTEPHLDLGPP